MNDRALSSVLNQSEPGVHTLDIQHNVSLAALNTFGFAQLATHYAEVATEEELIEAVDIASRQGWPLQILGGGSNLVLTRDVPGLTIRLVGDDIEYESAADHAPGSVVVTAAAGASWHALVLDTLEHGYGGLENLSLIPGTVGAAPVQNIGAYGVELADVLHSLVVWQVKAQAWCTLDREQCQFAYRESLFKRFPGEYIIMRVSLCLSSNRPLTLDYAGLRERLESKGLMQPSHCDVSRAVIEIRREKLPDPARIANAGSFFKNPVIGARQAHELARRFPKMVSYPQGDGSVKLAAGWLVDSLGYKGCVRDGVGVHEHQALVLVHLGGADGSTLLSLASEIMAAVKATYGVTLVPEPVII